MPGSRSAALWSSAASPPAQLRALGRESLAVPAAISIAFSALCALMPPLGAAVLRGPRWALLAALALCTTPLLPVLGAGQCADVPLAAFFAGAAVSLALGAPLL